MSSPRDRDIKLDPVTSSPRAKPASGRVPRPAAPIIHKESQFLLYLRSYLSDEEIRSAQLAHDVAMDEYNEKTALKTEYASDEKTPRLKLPKEDLRLFNKRTYVGEVLATPKSGNLHIDKLGRIFNDFALEHKGVEAVDKHDMEPLFTSVQSFIDKISADEETPGKINFADNETKTALEQIAIKLIYMASKALLDENGNLNREILGLTGLDKVLQKIQAEGRPTALKAQVVQQVLWSYIAQLPYTALILDNKINKNAGPFGTALLKVMYQDSKFTEFYTKHMEAAQFYISFSAMLKKNSKETITGILKHELHPSGADGITDDLIEKVRLPFWKDIASFLSDSNNAQDIEISKLIFSALSGNVSDSKDVKELTSESYPAMSEILRKKDKDWMRKEYPHYSAENQAGMSEVLDKAVDSLVDANDAKDSLQEVAISTDAERATVFDSYLDRIKKKLLEQAESLIDLKLAAVKQGLLQGMPKAVADLKLTPKSAASGSAPSPDAMSKESSKRSGPVPVTHTAAGVLASLPPPQLAQVDNKQDLPRKPFPDDDKDSAIEQWLRAQIKKWKNDKFSKPKGSGLFGSSEPYKVYSKPKNSVGDGKLVGESLNALKSRLYSELLNDIDKASRTENPIPLATVIKNWKAKSYGDYYTNAEGKGTWYKNNGEVIDMKTGNLAPKNQYILEEVDEKLKKLSIAKSKAPRK